MVVISHDRHFLNNVVITS